MDKTNSEISAQAVWDSIDEVPATDQLSLDEQLEQMLSSLGWEQDPTEAISSSQVIMQSCPIGLGVDEASARNKTKNSYLRATSHSALSVTSARLQKDSEGDSIRLKKNGSTYWTAVVRGSAVNDMLLGSDGCMWYESTGTMQAAYGRKGSMTCLLPTTTSILNSNTYVHTYVHTANRGVQQQQNQSQNVSQTWMSKYPMQDGRYVYCTLDEAAGEGIISLKAAACSSGTDKVPHVSSTVPSGLIGVAADRAGSYVQQLPDQAATRVLLDSLPKQGSGMSVDYMPRSAGSDCRHLQPSSPSHVTGPATRQQEGRALESPESPNQQVRVPLPLAASRLLHNETFISMQDRTEMINYGSSLDLPQLGRIQGGRGEQTSLTLCRFSQERGSTSTPSSSSFSPQTPRLLRSSAASSTVLDTAAGGTISGPPVHSDPSANPSWSGSTDFLNSFADDSCAYAASHNYRQTPGSPVVKRGQAWQHGCTGSPLRSCSTSSVKQASERTGYLPTIQASPLRHLMTHHRSSDSSHASITTTSTKSCHHTAYKSSLYSSNSSSSTMAVPPASSEQKVATGVRSLLVETSNPTTFPACATPSSSTTFSPTFSPLQSYRRSSMPE